VCPRSVAVATRGGRHGILGWRNRVGTPALHNNLVLPKKSAACTKSIPHRQLQSRTLGQSPFSTAPRLSAYNFGHSPKGKMQEIKRNLRSKGLAGRLGWRICKMIYRVAVLSALSLVGTGFTLPAYAAGQKSFLDSIPDTRIRNIPASSWVFIKRG
jgi:hypothetical protein